MVKVGIVMGSDSDLPCMSEAAKMLEELGVAYEMTIVSAHRTPERLASYAAEAPVKGIRVIVAGAGGAAHLPGMLAAYTPLPVIGVPIKTAALGGLDSLYSIAQMPKGVPVATVAIGGGANAGILAAQIVGAFDDEVRKAVERYKRGLADMVEEKAAKLESEGYALYLREMSRQERR